ncbi:endothelial protein C receptor [Nothoprocta perdicaria]|uniref:endothelial protein C receptor n=1 Tax=Nothoprocta perdicaria TaxID=30464 RepID=UPI000E1C2BE1|nr:endothelial protein C receptor [Nothoprocta perdicaria]
MLVLPLLCAALARGAEQAAPLAFTMLQVTRVSDGRCSFWGNATLGGRSSHRLEGRSLSQLLPLEPPAAWARRKEDVATYLDYFANMVKLIHMERRIEYTQILRCLLGCHLFPNGTARSFYDMTLNGTAFLSFHVPTATWERRWPHQDAVATFAHQELMKYPETTRDLQHFLNTTCVDILRAQSAGTGRQSSRSHTPLVVGLTLGALALVAMAAGIFLCTGGSC